ncbi:WW domain-binding protein 4 [Pelomyxa schiedti]|nr:WW domain-binding protein 4 [Pelomyxa schiedti]
MSRATGGSYSNSRSAAYSKYAPQKPRYYCEYCHTWIQVNAAARAQHESGFRHKENVSHFLTEARKKQRSEDIATREVTNELKKIEKIAQRQYEADLAGIELTASKAADDLEFEENVQRELMRQRQNKPNRPNADFAVPPPPKIPHIIPQLPAMPQMAQPITMYLAMPIQSPESPFGLPPGVTTIPVTTMETSSSGISFPSAQTPIAPEEPPAYSDKEAPMPGPWTPVSAAESPFTRSTYVPNPVKVKPRKEASTEYHTDSSDESGGESDEDEEQSDDGGDSDSGGPPPALDLTAVAKPRRDPITISLSLGKKGDSKRQQPIMWPTTKPQSTNTSPSTPAPAATTTTTSTTSSSSTTASATQPNSVEEGPTITPPISDTPGTIKPDPDAPEIDPQAPITTKPATPPTTAVTNTTTTTPTTAATESATNQQSAASTDNNINRPPATGFTMVPSKKGNMRQFRKRL